MIWSLTLNRQKEIMVNCTLEKNKQGFFVCSCILTQHGSHVHKNNAWIYIKESIMIKNSCATHEGAQVLISHTQKEQ